MNRRTTFPFVFFILALAFVSAFASAESPKSLTLVSGGQSNYRIVLPDEPTPVQQTAALELQKYLAEISGVELPIVSETDAKSSGKRIVLGPSALSQKLLGETLDESKIGYDGIALQVVGKDLVLTGHPQRGTLYAVYEFLERVLGCRFWMPDCETVPKTEKVKVPGGVSYQFTPKLVYRDAFYRSDRDGAFAAKIRNNGSPEITPELGNHHEFCHFVHSFYPILPPEKYFDAHPEWYSEVDGKRTCDLAQLCLTNEEMFHEFVKNAKEDLRENPDATFLSVSQNDWHENYCRCEKCTKLAEEEGSQSGPLIHFVNRVAEEIEKEFPNVYVETLAYTYTRKPPKHVRPRHNVVVRLCTIECSFSQPLSGEQNVKLCEDLDGWSKIAPNLFIWDYVTNFSFYLIPHPNYYVLAPNIRFFVDHNAIGIFEQGDIYTEAGDFMPLRAWVISKLLWDPTLDFDELKDEFVAGYYAPELVPIFDEYFKLMRSEVEKSGIYLGIYRQTVRDWLSFSGLNRATKLIRKAKKIAAKLEEQDPERYAGLVKKIERETFPTDLVWVDDWKFYRNESFFADQKWQGPKDYPEAVDEMIQRFDSYGLTRFREWDGEIQNLKEQLLEKKELWEKCYRKEYAPNPETFPEEVRNLPPKSWVEIEQESFNLHIPGKYVFIEEDPQASNGLTLRMGGDHTQWATSWSVQKWVHRMTPALGEENSEKTAGKFRVFAAVRCDATGTGRAMEIGIYDETQHKNLVYRALTAEMISGPEYHWIDLGEVEFIDENCQYFWAAPVNRPDEVQNVYVDRILVVH